MTFQPTTVAPPGTRTSPVEPAAGLEDAARRLGADPAEWRALARRFPIRWPEAYLRLAAGAEGEPIRRMGVPDASELVGDPFDLADPVGERPLAPTPFVVRKHADRAILLVTARCHFYCRFCFRPTFPDGSHRDPNRAQLAESIAALRADAGLREVILSGGDPLVLSDDALEEILGELSSIPQVERLRVHTRAPVHQPDRVTRELARVLASSKPLRLVTHFNHPVEVAAAPRAALTLLLEAGIPVLSQGPLLRGVNDDPDVLLALYAALDDADVTPYYLHHPDRAPGNARFRVSLDRGLAIWARVRERSGGTPLPRYVIDVPDGSGKVPVASLVPLDDGRWRAPSGHEWQDVIDAP